MIHFINNDMSLLDIDKNLDNFNDVYVKHICIKFYRDICNFDCEINFLQSDDINYRDVFENPNLYVLGRNIYATYTSDDKNTQIDIKLFKVRPNFYNIHPTGLFMSNMYLPPNSSMADILCRF